MKCRIHAALIIAASAVFGVSATAVAQGTPTADEVALIRAAVPKQPRVAPVRSRKVLVFSISWGYWHTAIPYGMKAFEMMGAQTGAFEAVVSNDLSMFEPANLRQFDAVVFNNTNEEIFLPEKYDQLPPAEKAAAAEYDRRLKESLTDYLRSGGGLAVIHAGVNSFRNWPEFGSIIGARFENHPWNAGSVVTLRVEEPDHPLAQAFGLPHFEFSDEIYQVAEPYSRENLRVLVSIDIDRTFIRLRDIDAIRRKDKDFAMTWIKGYGRGRVFYCAFGHQHELFWNTMVLQHFLDGVQFAAGDLACDVTPSAKLVKSK
ncbi:MAG: ThuA domain-containing protein [Phycisphaerae bacterium]|nr:ThuA domain-containing protein [Phycisphaerae bacterium]